jgi:hypothetical protein
MTTIKEQAAALLTVLSDGNPHSNGEIAMRTKWPWNHPHWARVRKYLRNHGYSLVFDAGYWTLTDKPTALRQDAMRRNRPLYSELCTRARSYAGAFSRNPTDMASEYEMKAAQSVAFGLGIALGMSPTDIAEDLKVYT